MLLGGKLGEGSFGVVYQAMLLSEDMTHTNGSEVAVKTVKGNGFVIYGFKLTQYGISTV